MNLQLYNYLSRRKERFTPLDENLIRMYVCGPTVYGHAHLGHAKVYITYDLLRRFLQHHGYRVRYVQNITDVGHLTDNGDSGEDKIQGQASRERVEPMEVVEYYMRSFFEDMDALGVGRPDISPRASGHIPEQLELAQVLIDAGLAYESEGSVYFSVADWPRYGRLSGRRVGELRDGVRVELRSGKRDPRDFAVWRAAPPEHLMRWKSPWGEGFPGWHAECTVMARKYLGLPFDIHGGGLENIFPHNEGELAQCEAAYGTDYAKYWVLNNMVTVDGQKMGKSLGNFTTIKDALDRFGPEVIRFFVLTSHYRANTDFSERALDSAAKGYKRLADGYREIQEIIGRAGAGTGNEAPTDFTEPHRRRLEAALEDDLNAPQAIAALFDLLRDLRPVLSSDSHAPLIESAELLRVYGAGILGLFPDDFRAPPPGSRSGSATDSAELIDILIDLRNDARKRKDWVTADAVRDRLGALGIALEDRPEATVVQR